MWSYYFSSDGIIGFSVDVLPQLWYTLPLVYLAYVYCLVYIMAMSNVH